MSTPATRRYYWMLLLPALIIGIAFFVLPMTRLITLSVEDGWLTYYRAIITERQYWQSLISTVALAAAVTAVSLLLSMISGLFLARNHFPGRTLLISMLTFPLAFPGVVIGFFVIMLGGRQGLSAQLGLAITGDRWVFAYSMMGLFIGYIYFSIPRVIVTVMASADKIDGQLIEAARALRAPSWRIFVDVTLPSLKPGLIASGSICFATAMGAFGTAFTLATDIDVLPMSIYTEFTLSANFGMAAALSVVLGVTTWICLWIANRYQNTNVVMGA